MWSRKRRWHSLDKQKLIKVCVHPWHCVIHCVCSAVDEWNTEGMWIGCLRCLSDCQVCQDEWGVCLREAPVLVSAELSGAWSTFICSALTDRKEESSKEQWDHDLQPSWNEIKEGNISVFFLFLCFGVRVKYVIIFLFSFSFSLLQWLATSTCQLFYCFQWSSALVSFGRSLLVWFSQNVSICTVRCFYPLYLKPCYVYI